MLRLSIFAATILAVGCQSTKPPVAPRPVDNDAPLRIRIAHAEARRAAGIDDLVELATGSDIHARELALRGLGRSGGAKALDVLEAALTDREPHVVTAALSAIGVAGSLDDKLEWKDEVVAAALLGAPTNDPAVRLAAAEALGRAGSTAIQPALITCLGDKAIARACALALGRHGRRKLAFSADVRRALAQLTSSSDDGARYAATYALAREHEPPADEAVAGALVARIADGVPEIRATAIAGLAKRKAVAAGRKAIESALADADWRVAVEAVRALSATDDAGRAFVTSALQRRWAELVEGNASEAHVIIEALRMQIGKPITDRAQADAIANLASTAKADTKLPAITRGWIECLARVAAPTAEAGQLVESIASCGLPDHLRLPLLAELVTNNLGDATARRAALRALLSHDDPRVRAAGLGVIASTWKEADAKAQQTIVTTLSAAIASKNPIVASAGSDAADALYDEMPADSLLRGALDSAIATRAATESDVELASSLLGLIGKRAIASGADACRAGLGATHPVRVKAAVDCLRKLGEAVPMPDLPEPPAPPNDVADVIGHHVTWHLETSRGPIDIALRPDVAPWAVATVVALTRRGYYDNLELHRVVPNFVAQGGDPTQSGYGGPGFTLPAEPGSAADGPGFMQGGVGMADAGPDSAGSQWFVMHSFAPHLDGRYTWIGSVASGQKSADALQIGDRVERATVTIE